MNRSKWMIIVLVTSITLTVLIGGLLLPRERTGNITVGELSDRAWEFILQQQQNAQSIWRDRTIAGDAVEPEPIQASQITTDCYSFTVPTQLRSTEKNLENNCSTTLRLASPPTRLTVMISPLTTPLMENPHLIMRESKPEEYLPVIFVSEIFPSAKVYRDPQGVTFFAEVDGELLSIAFSETTKQEVIIDEILPKLLNSLVIKPVDQRATPTMSNLEASASNQLQ